MRNSMNRHNKSKENNKTEWRKEVFWRGWNNKESSKKETSFNWNFLTVCRLLISVYIWVSFACSYFMKAHKNYTQLVYIASERKFQLFSFCRDFDCAINSLRTWTNDCATQHVKWKRLADTVGSQLLFSAPAHAGNFRWIHLQCEAASSLKTNLIIIAQF